MRFDPEKIYWQAHRGGGHEAPDNTLTHLSAWCVLKKTFCRDKLYRLGKTM